MMPVALVSTTPSLYKQTMPSSFVWSPFHKLTFTSYSAVCVSAFPSYVTLTVIFAVPSATGTITPVCESIFTTDSLLLDQTSDDIVHPSGESTSGASYSRTVFTSSCDVDKNNCACVSSSANAIVEGTHVQNTNATAINNHFFKLFILHFLFFYLTTIQPTTGTLRRLHN